MMSNEYEKMQIRFQILEANMDKDFYSLAQLQEKNLDIINNQWKVIWLTLIFCVIFCIGSIVAIYKIYKIQCYYVPEMELETIPLIY